MGRDDDERRPMQNTPYILHDFEDGVFDLDRNPNSLVPTRIDTDPDGNSYLRIEANYGDQDWIPSRFEDRVRSFVWATERHHNMDPLTEDNALQSYSADIRFHGYDGARGPVRNQFFELFQTSSTNPENSYGDKSGDTGPNIRFTHLEDGTVRVSYTTKDASNTTVWNSEVLGTFQNDTFYNFRIDAVWSHDPAEGRYDVYVDDELRLTIENIATNVGPTADLLPSLKLGLYGDNAVGVVDVDNVEIYEGHPTNEETYRVQTDDANQFVWSEIVETFDASGEMVHMRRTFDDGRVAETNYTGGTKSEMVMSDPEDAHAWSQSSVVYDGSGAPVSSTRTFDDGVVLTTTFENGIRVKSVSSDVSDAKSWETRTDNYDNSGTLAERNFVYDDGSFETISYNLDLI